VAKQMFEVGEDFEPAKEQLDLPIIIPPKITF
jgi:hypothetical protein